MAKNDEIKDENVTVEKDTKEEEKVAKKGQKEAQAVIVRPLMEINVRRLPHNGDGSLWDPPRYVNPSDRLEVLDSEGDWLYCVIDGYKGWVRKSLVE